MRFSLTMGLSRSVLHKMLFCFTILLVTASIAAQTPFKTGYTISGTVINAASGEPVRRAVVSVQEEASRQTIATVESDSEGRFSIDGLAAGKYPLSASKRGFLTAFYDEHEGNFNTAIVTGADQETGGLVFNLVPGASLSGVVTGDGGDPVEGAQVLLFLKPHSHNPGDRILKVEDTMTDDTGAYEFDGLAAGEYMVAVKAEPWFAMQGLEDGPGAALEVAYPVTYFDSTTDEASATSVVLAGGSREEANLNLRAVPALRIAVESPINQNGVSVSANLQQTIFGTKLFNILDDPPVRHGNIDEFALTGVAPGHYELTQGNPPRVAELDVSTSEQIDQNLGVAAMGLTGILRSENGSDLPAEMAVILFSLDETQNRAPQRVNANSGKFSFDAVPPGKWELWATSNGEEPTITSLTVGGRTHPGNQLTMRDQPLKVVATVSQSERRVEGFAWKSGVPGDRSSSPGWKDGKGQPGVMIVMVPKDLTALRSLERRDQSDSDGSFSLRFVAPGAYTVVAIENGWDLDWQRPEVIGRYLSGGISVTVTETSGKLLRLTEPVQVQRP